MAEVQTVAEVTGPRRSEGAVSARPKSILFYRYLIRNIANTLKTLLDIFFSREVYHKSLEIIPTIFIPETRSVSWEFEVARIHPVPSEPM